MNTCTTAQLELDFSPVSAGILAALAALAATDTAAEPATDLSALPAPQPDALDLEKWIRTHTGYIKSQLLRMGVPSHELDDMFSELMCLTWRYRSHYDPVNYHPLTFICAIVGKRTLANRFYNPQKKYAWLRSADMERSFDSIQPDSYNLDTESDGETMFGGHTDSAEVESGSAVSEFIEMLQSKLSDQEQQLLDVLGMAAIEADACVADCAAVLRISAPRARNVVRSLQAKAQAFAAEYFGRPDLLLAA